MKLTSWYRPLDLNSKWHDANSKWHRLISMPSEDLVPMTVCGEKLPPGKYTNHHPAKTWCSPELRCKKCLVSPKPNRH